MEGHNVSLHRTNQIWIRISTNRAILNLEVRVWIAGTQIFGNSPLPILFGNRLTIQKNTNGLRF